MNYNLEIKKVEMKRQRKVAELIVQMKHGEGELLGSYMESINSIIKQNAATYQTVVPLLQQLGNDKLSGSIKKATESSIEKTYKVLYILYPFIYICWYD